MAQEQVQLLEKKTDWREYSNIISDEYTLKILADTYLAPKSVLELSVKHEIPIAACYRAMHRLELLGLVRCVNRKLTLKGKRVKVYLSSVRNISLFFEHGKLKVRVELNTSPEMYGIWDVLEKTK